MNEKKTKKTDLMHIAKTSKTTGQTAAILSCSKRTVVRLLDEGELSGFQCRTRWRISIESIEAYIKRQILKFEEDTGNIFMTDSAETADDD